MIRILSFMLLSMGIALTYLSPSMLWVLSVNLVVISLNIGLFFLQRPAFLRLNIMWQLAFLYIIISEGFVYHSKIISTVGEANAITALKYMCLSNLTVLLFFSTFYQEAKAKQIANVKKTIHYGKILPLGFIIILHIVFFYMYTGIASARIQQGFAAYEYQEMVTDGTLTRVQLQIAFTAGILLPALITYYLKYVLRIKHVFILAFIFSLPALVIIIAMNSRHRLFFAVLGLLLVCFNKQKLDLRLFSKLAITAIALIVFSSFALLLRRGIDHFHIPDKTLLEQVFADNQYITNNARLVDYFQYNSHRMGKSIASWFVVWIPRKFWPDKPTKSGYWFIREYQGDWKKSLIHSVSFSFSGDPYIDFGFFRGILFCCFFFGGILVFAEKWTAYHIGSDGHCNILICSMMYSWAFFCMKSFVTSTIILLGTIIFISLFQLTLRTTTELPENEL